jgi:hypothetical protein
VAKNISVTNAGLAFVVFAGSTMVPRDTAKNEVIGLVGRGLDPDGVWAGSSSAGVLVIDNGLSPKGRPRNNQVVGATLDTGPHGSYGWLDTSSGASNAGRDIGLEHGAPLQKCVLVRNGRGGVQFKGRATRFTDLDPSHCGSQ